MHSLDDITSGLPKLRKVAAHALCCNDGSFSLSKYPADAILFVWRFLGIKAEVSDEQKASEAFCVEVRQASILIESKLVERDFDKNPLSPPYVIGEV